jgi:hypothetical protein
MSYSNILGFDNNQEFLPNDFDTFDSQVKLRQLFLHLSNCILDNAAKFTSYEQKFYSKLILKNAFNQKIKSMLPISFVKKHKISGHFNFCIQSTKVINNYLNKKVNTNVLVTTKVLVPSARLISICYVNNKMQLIIDKNLLFHEFVLEKIRKLHKDKEVIDLGDSISIKQDNVCALKLYTSWKTIQSKKLDIKDELEDAIKVIKKGDFNQIYLIYPKSNDFNKHIPVYVDELENKTYQIKAVPYSLRSIIRKN